MEASTPGADNIHRLGAGESRGPEAPHHSCDGGLLGAHQPVGRNASPGGVVSAKSLYCREAEASVWPNFQLAGDDTLPC